MEKLKRQIHRYSNNNLQDSMFLQIWNSNNNTWHGEKFIYLKKWNEQGLLVEFVEEHPPVTINNVQYDSYTKHSYDYNFNNHITKEKSISVIDGIVVVPLMDDSISYNYNHLNRIESRSVFDYSTVIESALFFRNVLQWTSKNHFLKTAFKLVVFFITIETTFFYSHVSSLFRFRKTPTPNFPQSNITLFDYRLPNPPIRKRKNRII